MNRIFRGTAVLAAAVLGIGVLALGGPASSSEDQVTKREESLNLVLTGDDDDDDDTDTGGGGDTYSANQDSSGVSNDGTNSRFSRVSRDRDNSRGDLTKDFTRDGGDRTRDFSQNRTNDRSRNDTR